VSKQKSKTNKPKAEASAPAPAVRLLDKAEVCAIANVTFPTLWAWMRRGKFPRARTVAGTNSKSFWLSTEVDAWMASLPMRPLKGDSVDATP
jgi:predicted DNA-binding transcriptional regulator AlpA